MLKGPNRPIRSLLPEYMPCCSLLLLPKLFVNCVTKLLSFSRIVLSTHPSLFYQLLSPDQTFVIFSPFFIYTLFTLSTHSICVPALHTKQHNDRYRLFVRTPSAPIQLLLTIVVFGHRTILIWGDRDMAEGFLVEHSDTLHLLQTSTMKKLNMTNAWCHIGCLVTSWRPVICRL